MAKKWAEMNCPKCQNKGFEPGEILKPIKNIGGKENYVSFDVRRYVCLQCGYAWKTIEKFYDEIKIKKNNQISLFDEHK